MKPTFFRILALCFALLVSLPLLAADETNSAPVNTNDIANSYVQLQAQLHTAQLQIELSREEAAEAAQHNVDRIQLLEQNLAVQRLSDARVQRLTLYLAGTVSVAILAVLLLAGYFQWRAFSQLAQVTAHHSAALAMAQGVQQLAAPGRAT